MRGCSGPGCQGRVGTRPGRTWGAVQQDRAPRTHLPSSTGVTPRAAGLLYGLVQFKLIFSFVSFLSVLSIVNRHATRGRGFSVRLVSVRMEKHTSTSKRASTSKRHPAETESATQAPHGEKPFGWCLRGAFRLRGFCGLSGFRVFRFVWSLWLRVSLLMAWQRIRRAARGGHAGVPSRGRVRFCWGLCAGFQGGSAPLARFL